ncbi:MAG: hypothetical protein LUF91_06330 [Oscillospiraceae bacterium]|nr:hypothetical protein [Oscillospiraceae bacterium]
MQGGNGEIFIIQARRCKRCGGLLTSAEALKDGYGHVCRMKTREEELQKKAPDPNQINLFESLEAE